MAEVAIRKIAAVNAERRDLADMLGDLSDGPDNVAGPAPLDEIDGCSINSLPMCGRPLNSLRLAHVNFRMEASVFSFHNSVKIVQQFLFCLSTMLLKC
ncbi:hypothetical protein [Sinorhizobium fredii]|uniref:hypothetical protein n=1 Tax=Rhizobium fredii TaxID=380 RepID=UPI0015826D7D|nr:hypothetical protein [Sinorhizobium fredii]